MVPPSGPGAPRTASPMRWSKAPPLSLSPDLSLPLRQDAVIPSLPWPQVTEAIRSTLGAAGFGIVSVVERRAPVKGASAAGAPLFWETLSERGRRSIPMGAATRASLYALFGAGFGLGLFDAIAVRVPLFALPWGGGAALVAFLFWYRYGRSFKSEVMLVAVRPTRGAAARGLTVAWIAGVVTSDARGSHRVGVEATDTPAMARAAGELARAFRDRVTGPAAA
jgi:hypothetical protein